MQKTMPKEAPEIAPYWAKNLQLKPKNKAKNDDLP